MPDAYIQRTREFFGARAATWDTKFGHDMPVYAAAIAEAGLRRGGVAVDAGCGTGRALPSLRDAVGPEGTVIGLELTPQMLVEARSKGWAKSADLLILADARALPLASTSVDAVFAAGLVNHLPDPPAGLAELARITRPGGILTLFHPIGRTALAARHGRTVSPGEILSPAPLRAAAAAAGWDLTVYDDVAERFLALAIRRLPGAVNIRLAIRAGLSDAAAVHPAAARSGDHDQVPQLHGGVAVDVMQEAVRLSGEREPLLLHPTALAGLPDQVQRAARGDAGADVAGDVGVVAADQLRVRTDVNAGQRQDDQVDAQAEQQQDVRLARQQPGNPLQDPVDTRARLVIGQVAGRADQAGRSLAVLGYDGGLLR
jgi:SAM-dependent methyltransferase